MKKNLLAALLVAILASSMVFAGFSGSASVGFGGNLDNGNFGFISQGSGVCLDVELSTANGEAKGEGSVYASIKGSMSAWLIASKAGNNPSDPKNAFAGDIRVAGSISEAKVAGENWSVSILGAPDGLDYAKSAIDFYSEAAKDTWDRGLGYQKYKPYTFAAPYAKTNGLTVNVYDYKLGLALLGDYNKNNTKVNFAGLVETPEYNFSGVTVQAGVSYAYNEFEKIQEGVAKIVDSKYKPTNAMGISAKAGYTQDAISASLATDMGIDFLETTKDEDRFNADVSANFTYDFVGVDFYYATLVKNVKNLVSVQASLDFNSFNVPVALTIAAQDLVNEQALSAEVVVTAVENLKLTGNAGYAIQSKEWDTGLKAEYKVDEFTAKGAISVASEAKKDAPIYLGASASVETEALINGAKLGLAWSGAKDLLDKDPEVDNYGKIMASCTIKF